jgi:hypothetical protein
MDKATVQKEYADALNPVLAKAQQDMVTSLNEAGWRRNGQLLTTQDVIDLRNAKSMGTVGMDRDLALNQMQYRETQLQLEKLPPGSAQAHDLNENLRQLEVSGQLTHNGEPVSALNANKDFQDAYNQAYKNATIIPGHPDGFEAGPALQAVTQSKHPEAYQDLPILKNNALDYPPAAKWAEQSGSVTTYKSYMNPTELSPGDALQETARGAYKDINTKLEPLMYWKGSDPDAYQRVLDMKSFLNDCGKGVYTPSQMQALAQQKFGTSIDGLAQQVDSNLAASIKQIGPTPPAFRALPGPGLSELGTHVASSVAGPAGQAAGIIDSSLKQHDSGDQRR